MGKKPVIGIISAKHDMAMVLPYYVTSAHYLDQVAQAGAIPMQIPVMEGMDDDTIAEILSRCDGFLLPGGADFDASWYGEELLSNLTPDTGGLSLPVQESSLRLIRAAAASGKPILGICLGMQVINVAFGGSLYQDIPMQIPGHLHHAYPIRTIDDRWHLEHTVQIEPDSLLYRICEQTKLWVNSFHHQAVKVLAPGFRITAVAPDGVAEAMEHENGRILAVQWHPENLAQNGMTEAKLLFQWLAEQAREHN